MQFSNSSGPHQLASAQPAGVSPHHEGFADFYSGGIARAYQVRDLSSVERNGLLAQNMLACLGRLERPGNVQMIGQGIIDGVDRRILEQFFVGSVCFRNFQLLRCGPRGAQVARANRRDFD